MAATDARMAAPAPVSFGLMRRILVAFLVLAAASAAVNVSGRIWGHALSLGGHSDDRTLREIVIGADVITAPSNMIRFESQRRSGVSERLDLYIHWPTLEGYDEKLRDDFNGGGNIVFLTFGDRHTSRDMADRLDPIYSHLTAGAPARDAETGLEVRTLSEASGYMGEQLLVGRRTGDAKPFVARCLAPGKDVHSLAPCERDVFVGEDLAMMVRFPRALLADWDHFDRTIAAFARTLVAQ